MILQVPFSCNQICSPGFYYMVSLTQKPYDFYSLKEVLACAHDACVLIQNYTS